MTITISIDEAIRFLSQYDNEYHTPKCRLAHRMGIEALTDQQTQLKRIEEPKAKLLEERHRHDRYKELTNADRIRAMSDRELAEFLAKKFTDNEAVKAASKGDVLTATYLSEISYTWFKVWMQWLRQPSEGSQ